MNPLGTLCAQMGLGEQELGRRAGLTTEQVAAALAADPSEPLRSFLVLVKLLGVQMQVKGVKQFGFSVALQSIDDLFFDAGWRSAHGLLEAGKTYGALWALLRRLHPKIGYQEIARQLERSIVPTASGRRTWHRSVVMTTLKQAQTQMADEPIVPGEECIAAWRSLVIGTVLAEICPADAMAGLRYEFEVSPPDEQGQIRFASKQPIPVAVAGWMQQALDSMTWMAKPVVQSDPPPAESVGAVAPSHS
jgi:hypothetical protein